MRGVWSGRDDATVAAEADERASRRWGARGWIRRGGYRCHHCHEESPGPETEYREYQPVPGAAWERVASIHWGSPLGLSRCSRCRRWTCDECLQRGACACHANRLRSAVAWLIGLAEGA